MKHMSHVFWYASNMHVTHMLKPIHMTLLSHVKCMSHALSACGMVDTYMVLLTPIGGRAQPPIRSCDHLLAVSNLKMHYFCSIITREPQ